MTVRYANRAGKDMQNLPLEDRERVLNAVDRLAASGVGDIRALGGPLRGRFRLRVGRWRVIFRRDDDIVVLRVLHRREAYR